MKKLFFLVILSTLIVSCNQTNEKKTEKPAQPTSVAEVVNKEKTLPPLKNEEVNLTDDVFGNIIELTGVSKVSDYILGISGLQMIANDSMLITKSYGAKLFTLFSLPDFKFIKTFGDKGRGPGEFSFPSLVKTENSNSICYIYSSNTNELFPLIKNNEIAKTPIKIKSTSEYNARQIHGLSPNHLLYVENIKRGKAVFDFKVDGDSTHTKQIYNLAFSKNHRNWAAYIGDFGANGSKKRFVYAYKYFKRLVFHDLENNTTKVVNFNTAPALAGDVKDMLAPTNVTHYWGMSAQKNYVYVLYSGRTPIQIGKENNKTSGYIYVEQFDWNGNPIRKFKLDHWGYFCVNDAENTIILASTTELDPFFTYDIPAL